MKQETLEDFCIKFIERHFEDEKTYNKSSVITAMKASAKWQQERSYSEEEVIAFGEFIFKHTLLVHSKGVRNLFEQFKKK